MSAGRPGFPEPWGLTADVIVTGDQDLLTLGRIGQISILTPREFLEAQQHGI